MENAIIIAVVLVLVGLAVFRIYKAKKSGKKCIGCPYGGSCGGACSSRNSGCNGKDKDAE